MAEIVATYDYRDVSGNLRYQVVRYEPKDFRVRRPDGSGGWVWGINGCERVLYRLPELLVNPQAGVFVAEGEKSVDRLVALGLVATCNVFGAGKWEDSYSESLRDRAVVILPDYDALDERTGKRPGWEHALMVKDRLRGCAKRVEILEYLGFSPADTGTDWKKQDIDDWLDAGHTADELRQLVRDLLQNGTGSVRKPSEVVSASGPQESGKVDCAASSAVLGTVHDSSGIELGEVLRLARGLSSRDVLVAINALVSELSIRECEKKSW